ncbi:hypothetical protein C9439_05735 [archaeon SCG-AAA382B04]|nr:hypothetical protein C9439_05735 [archaeon SCG-AAA382B04]
MNVPKLVSGLIVLVLSALILADGVIGYVDSAIFFEGVNNEFKIVVAFIFIILVAQVLEQI